MEVDGRADGAQDRRRSNVRPFAVHFATVHLRAGARLASRRRDFGWWRRVGRRGMRAYSVVGSLWAGYGFAVVRFVNAGVHASRVGYHAIFGVFD